MNHFSFFHFVNTFDTEEGLAFDIVRYDNADIIDSYYLENLDNSRVNIPGGKLCRFSVNLNDKLITSDIISDASIELPQFDASRYNMRPEYNFVYAMGLKSPASPFYDQLVKIDIASRDNIFWEQEGCFPGEPVFIPGPDSQKEDDGIIMSLIIDTREEQSYLLILNARNLEEISRVKVPEPIMAGFHGNYFQN